jgi:hypothetical protein
MVMVGDGSLPFPRLFKLGQQRLSRGAVAHDKLRGVEERSSFLGSSTVGFDADRRRVLGSNGCRNHRHHVVIRISEVTLGDMV